MVVGNGLVAREMKRFETDGSVIVFASGVSNSTNSDKSEFEREKSLLLSFKNSEKLLVYFSTLSVFDPSLLNSPYIQHKKEIEELIPRNFERFLIFRLPILVGKTENPKTLTNFLYNKIKNQDSFELQVNARRFLFDSIDMAFWCGMMIDDSKYHNQIIDIYSGSSIGVKSIVHFLEEIIGTKANYIELLRGSSYEGNNMVFDELLSIHGMKIPEDYPKQVLAKYYRK